MYLAYGPSKTGYTVSQPYGPSEIEIGQQYLILPGNGTAKSNCGEVRFAVGCSDHNCRDEHGVKLVKENCGRLSCPVCKESAVDRAAARAVERIEGLISAYAAEGIKTGPLDHCQLSTRADDPLFTREAFSTREGINRAFARARLLLKRHVRYYGGVLVLHPWRQIHPDGSECGRHDCDKPHVWTWSPHFHFIGFGWWTKSDDFFRLTGWTYSKFGHGIKKRAGVDESQRSLHNTIRYQLTHCGLLVEGKHIYDSNSQTSVQGTVELAQVGQVLRYVGLLSNAKGGYRVESASYEVQACPHCKADLHTFDLVQDDAGNWSIHSDRGPLMEWVEVRKWYINHKTRQSKLPDDTGQRSAKNGSTGGPGPKRR